MRYTRLSYMITLLLLACITAKAQGDSVFQFQRHINGSFSYFSVDNLDNIYAVNSDNQLVKYGPNGDSLASFNDVKRYGNPGSVDVTNPLKLLLYYQPYSTVVVLDRLLNIRNTINFRRQNIFAVQHIATSYDNNIWIFDEQDNKLKKINEDGSVQLESNDFRMIFDTVPQPVQLIDRDNYVYLYDTAKGFYIFDYYGALKNRLPFLHWSNVEVAGKTMYGFSGNKLFSYELNSFNLKEYSLPASLSGFTAIRAMNRKIYLLRNNGIDIYAVR